MALLGVGVHRFLRDGPLFIDPQTEFLAEVHFHAQPIRVGERRVVEQHLADVPLDRAAPTERLSQEDSDIRAMLDVRDRVASRHRLVFDRPRQLAVDVETSRVLDRPGSLDECHNGRLAEEGLERTRRQDRIVPPPSGEVE